MLLKYNDLDVTFNALQSGLFGVHTFSFSFLETFLVFMLFHNEMIYIKILSLGAHAVS